MMRKTYTILAVAITATTAACGGTQSGSRSMTDQELAQELSNTSLDDAIKNREHFAPLCDEQGDVSGAKITQFCAAIAPSAPETKPAAEEPPTTPVTPAATACDKDALNKELSNQQLESALTQPQHFRCLCDDQGYPLVGNINSKGTTASAFCGALKEKGLL
jgi:hypothetical protein